MRQVLDACAAAVDILVQEAAEAGAAATPGKLRHGSFVCSAKQITLLTHAE
jgi:hypothetical protein